MRGDDAALDHSAAITAAVADATGFDNADCRRLLALSRSHLAHRRFEDALRAQRELGRRQAIGISALALADTVEAAVRVSEDHTAEATIHRLAELVDGSDTEWGLGLLERARGLRRAGGDAHDHLVRSIDLLERSGAAYDAARSRLLLGEALLDNGDPRGGAEVLHRTAEAFQRMGAPAFARRAAEPIEEMGGRGPVDTGCFADVLTTQERQVAELAAQELTNREIAARLYVSPSTVDYHLRKVFKKLHISSRRDIRQAVHPWS